MNVISDVHALVSWINCLGCRFNDIQTEAFPFRFPLPRSVPDHVPDVHLSQGPHRQVAVQIRALQPHGGRQEEATVAQRVRFAHSSGRRIVVSFLTIPTDSSLKPYEEANKCVQQNCSLCERRTFLPPDNRVSKDGVSLYMGLSLPLCQ